jgi:aspartate beta-hydroxylase
MENSEKSEGSNIEEADSFTGDDFKNSIWYKKLTELFQDYFLTDVLSLAAFKYIREKIINKSSDAERVIKWVMMRVNNKSLPDVYHERQLGCPDLVPGLTIKPFWEPSHFSFIDELLKHFDTIKEELINLRSEKGFQPYKSPNYASDIKSNDNLGSLAHDKGEWNVFYLYLHDVKFEENCGRCPKTAELIEKIVPRQYQ